MTYKIQMLPSDIEEGLDHDAKRGPVSLAINRFLEQFPNSKVSKAVVATVLIFLYNEAGCLVHSAFSSTLIRNFEFDFDAFKRGSKRVTSISPIDFEVDIPNHVLGL